MMLFVCITERFSAPEDNIFRVNALLPQCYADVSTEDIGTILCYFLLMKSKV